MVVRAHSAMGTAKKGRGIGFLVEVSLPPHPRTEAAGHDLPLDAAL